MGKPVRSRVIEAFIAAIEFEKISATTESPGLNAPEILGRVKQALQAILDGEDPSAALELRRQSGPTPKPETLYLAIMINLAKERGDSWAAIKALADELLTRSGRRKLGLTRLKDLYSKNKAEAARLVSTVRRIQAGAKRGEWERISQAAAKLMLVVIRFERFIVDPYNEPLFRGDVLPPD